MHVALATYTVLYKIKYITILNEANHNYFAVVMNELPLAQRIIYDASCATRHTSIQTTVKDHAISDVAMQDALEAVDRGTSI